MYQIILNLFLKIYSGDNINSIEDMSENVSENKNRSNKNKSYKITDKDFDSDEKNMNGEDLNDELPSYSEVYSFTVK